MLRRFNTSILLIYLIYLAAIAMTTALLVFWVLVVQRFNTEINQMVSRLGVEWNGFHWFIHSTGAALFFLVIAAITYLLGITLSERRYSVKQTEFLSNITHELKTPVAAIQLHGQTLQQGDLTPEEQQRFVGFILSEATRIGGLVDNLLEGSRLASDSSRELRPVNLREFFKDYQEVARNRFDLRQIDLTFEVQSRSVVMATTESLQRVMDNLLDNALRFTEAGGRILFKVQDDHDAAEIIVADTGVGIPKRELPKIFNRFYRLSREIGGKKHGTGLGLSIVRSLVEEMRGQIRAVPQDEQKGARFEIRLPQADVDGSAPDVSASDVSAPEAHPLNEPDAESPDDATPRTETP